MRSRPQRSLNEARSLLDRLGSGRVLIVPDADADGLSSGALAFHAVGARGGEALLLHPARGTHVHSPEVGARIGAIAPDLLLVFDQGSRAGAIAPGTPTIVVDHHVPDGEPDGAVFVSGAEREDIASTSELAWEVLDGDRALPHLAWLAAFGAVGDSGAGALKRWPQVSGKTALTKAVSLVNAANRSATFEVDMAFDALIRAKSAADIVNGASASARRLAELKAEVAAEVSRCGRVAPKISRDRTFALLLFSSRARVHPLVAQRWTGRLNKQIVIAANVGFLPGRVNFAMRTALDVDLLGVLGEHTFPDDAEVGHGHRKATGGSLAIPDFIQFVRALGFDEKTMPPLAQGETGAR